MFGAHEPHRHFPQDAAAADLLLEGLTGALVLEVERGGGDEYDMVYFAGDDLCAAVRPRGNVTARGQFAGTW